MATLDVGRDLVRADDAYTPNVLGQPPQGYNVFGTNLPLSNPPDFWADFFKQGGALSNVMNYVPGMPAIADFHDTWMNNVTPSSSVDCVRRVEKPVLRQTRPCR